MKNFRYKNLHWGISTLGCPELDLAGAVELAERYNMEFFEVRTISNSNEPWITLAVPENAGVMRKLVAADRCRVLDSSFGLTAINEDARAALLKTARVADEFNIPYIRVFGGGAFTDEFTPERIKAAEENLAWYAAQNCKAKLALETHDICSSTSRCAELLKIAKGELFIVWDAHHTRQIAGDVLAESYQILKDYIVTVHFKDSVYVYDADNVRYCEYTLPGEGLAGLDELFSLLDAEKPDFPVIFEHEKFWRKNLPELPVVLDAWQNFCTRD